MNFPSIFSTLNFPHFKNEEPASAPSTVASLLPGLATVARGCVDASHCAGMHAGCKRQPLSEARSWQNAILTDITASFFIVKLHPGWAGIMQGQQQRG